MKVYIKNLRGDKLEVDAEPSETVLYLKQKIQALQGHDPELQKLILAGKILEDAKQLSEYNIVEGATLVIMITKPKPQAKAPEATQPVVPPQRAQQPPAEPIQPQTQSTQSTQPIQPGQPASFFSQSAGALVSGEELEGTIKGIVDMGFPRDQVIVAMRAAYNNPDRAIDYLMNGIPEQPEHHAEPARPGAPSQQTGENALSFLLQNPMFLQLRSLLQQNPQMLGPLLGQLQQGNPQLFQMIMAHQEDFMRLIQDPLPESARPHIDPSLIAGLPRPPQGASTGSQQSHAPQVPGHQPQPGRQQHAPRHQNQLTPEEEQQVKNLAELGYHPRDALEAYLSCDKNETMAANLLFDNYQPMPQMPAFQQIPQPAQHVAPQPQNQPAQDQPAQNEPGQNQPAQDQPPQDQPPQDQPPQDQPPQDPPQ